MVLGSISKESPTPLLIAAKPVQQVPEYKFLGVTVNSRLKWDDHIAAITSKAAKRLWFLKRLKRAGVSREDLVYCCPTSPGVCMPGLAHEHHKRSNKVARRYPAPCCPGHRRQHPVRRSMLYAELISIRCLIDVVACAVHCLIR